MASTIICDAECQKDKRLKTLQDALYEATLRKGVDPAAYEQARQNYYTVKDGVGWLHAEKERVSNNTTQSVINSYISRFNSMKQNIASQNSRQQATKDEQDGQVGDEDEARFIHSLINREKDKAGVHQRTLELMNSVLPNSWWNTPLFFDILIGLLILFIAILLFGMGKFSKIMGYFQGTQTTLS